MPLPAALHSGLPSAGASQFLTQAGSGHTLPQGTATTSFHLPAVPCPLPSPPPCSAHCCSQQQCQWDELSQCPCPCPPGHCALDASAWGQCCGKLPALHGTSPSLRKGTQITSTVLLTESCSAGLLPEGAANRSLARGTEQLCCAGSSGSPEEDVELSPPSFGGSNAATGKGDPQLGTFGILLRMLLAKKLEESSGITEETPWDTRRVSSHHCRGLRAVTASLQHWGFTDSPEPGTFLVTEH